MRTFKGTDQVDYRILGSQHESKYIMATITFKLVDGVWKEAEEENKREDYAFETDPL